MQKRGKQRVIFNEYKEFREYGAAEDLGGDKEFKEFKEYRERAHRSNLPELPLPNLLNFLNFPNLLNFLNPPPGLSPRPNFLSEWYRCVADMKNPPMGST